MTYKPNVLESPKEIAANLPINSSYLFGLHHYLSLVVPFSFMTKTIM